MRPCARRSTSAGPATSAPTSPPGSSKPRDLLPQADAPSKEIYVFTDNQALSWEGLEGAGQEDDRQEGEGARRAAPVVVVNVEREPAPNVALQDDRARQPGAGGRRARSRPPSR